jgi:hypothetical protein
MTRKKKLKLLRSRFDANKHLQKPQQSGGDSRKPQQSGGDSKKPQQSGGDSKKPQQSGGDSKKPQQSGGDSKKYSHREPWHFPLRQSIP